MPTQPIKLTLFMRFLNKIELWGNKLPDPVMIFIGLCVITIIASAVLSGLGVSAYNPVTKETIHIINLLTIEGLTQILTLRVLPKSLRKPQQTLPPSRRLALCLL